jgi:hypothetical protein
LLQPQDENRSLWSPSKGIRFQWSSNKEADWLIKIADNSDLEQAIGQHVFSETSYTAYSLAPDKRYYWAIYNADDMEIASPIYSFKLFDSRPPIPLSPPKATHVVMNDDSKAKTWISWKKSSYYTGYEVQVSRHENFAETEHKRSLPESRMELELQDEGTRYWRVRGKRSDGSFSDWSTKFDFLVKNEAEFHRMNPTQAAFIPIKTASVTVPQKESSEATTTTSTTTTTTTTTTSTTTTTTTTTTSTTTTTTTTTTSTTTTTTTTTTSTSTTTTATTTTTQLTTTTIASKPSNKTRVSLKVKPSNLAPNNAQFQFYKGIASKVHFTWRGDEAAKQYLVQISRQKSFKKILKKKVTQTSDWQMQSVLPKGKLYWRVKARAGKEVSKWSEPASFDVELLPTLARPKTLSPINETIVCPTVSCEVSFSWTEVTTAEKYLVEIFINNDKKELHDTLLADQNTISTNLNSNVSYLWQVTAAKAQANGTFSKISESSQRVQFFVIRTGQ